MFAFHSDLKSSLVLQVNKISSQASVLFGHDLDEVS